MTKITIERSLIEQAIEALPDVVGMSHFPLRTKLRAALAEPAVEPVAEVVDYILQDDIHNRLTPRVVDIAYSAFMRGRSGINSDDGGPCDWFNDTKPMVMNQIAKIKKDLAEAAAPVREILGSDMGAEDNVQHAGVTAMRVKF